MLTFIKQSIIIHMMNTSHKNEVFFPAEISLHKKNLA